MEPWAQSLAGRGKRKLSSIAGRATNLAYGLAHRFDESRYCIVPGYRHRVLACYFDDTENDDEWQREVYLYARHVMMERQFARVYDVGCGSGFKLMKYLGEFETVGIDVAATVEFLRNKYPNRRWEVSGTSARYGAAPDLLVCADVIEHVADPDHLIALIKDAGPQFAVLSTPDRNLMYPPASAHMFGPPRNPAHLREWAFEEFERYISKSFSIIDHIISNHDQGTQLIFCTPTTSGAVGA